MSYMALYRKFRPAEFDDVKGQDHIVTTLKNQIIHERLGHAYLFCGTRGTGKTTIAKIFAKAINCESPVDGSPCGKCASCRSIAEGSSMNVIEMDAASNNGVDNIRQLREDVRYAPTQGKYKVYIIDEAHMITSSAFNAFLKTLEEPPSYVVFILATTEVNAIPITILSRCQRYDFKRITVDEISNRMSDLMKTEGVSVSKDALDYIARIADGSMRDALSMLDQCIAFYLGRELTYEGVLDVLGAVDNEIFFRLTTGIKEGDSLGVISIIDEIFMKGREVTAFVKDYIWFLRNMLISRTGEDAYILTGMSKDNYKRLSTLSKEFEVDIIERYIRVLSDLSNKIRYDNAKRVLTEIAFLKLIKPQMESDDKSLVNRIAIIEDKLEKGSFTVVQKTDLSGQPIEKKKVDIAAMPEDMQELVKRWDEMIEYVGNAYKPVLPYAHPFYENGVFKVLIDAQGKVYAEGRLDVFSKECSDCARHIIPGKQFDIVASFLDDDEVYEDNYEDLRQKIAQYNFETDDNDNNYGKDEY